MFECLTGQPPFTGHLAAAVMFSQLEADPPSLESIVGKGRLPASMEIVMAKLLRKNPVERYQTLLELRGDLEKVARGEDVQPFYLSRGRLSQNHAGEDGVETGRRGEERALKLKQLSLAAMSLTAVLIGIVLIVFAARALYQHLTPGNAHDRTPEDPGNVSLKEFQAVTTKQSDTSSSSMPAPPASAKKTAPYSTVVEENGRKSRVFDFPNDKVIGVVFVNVAGHYLGEVPAKGRCKFPFDAQLDFRPGPIVLEYPDYIKRFRRGDIFGVTLPVTADGLYDDDSMSLRGQYLQILAAVPGVQSIDMSVSNDVLTAEELSLLEKFTSLKAVAIRGQYLDANLFSKLSNLGQLETIQLSAGGDLTPILKSLKRSTHIKKLSLSSGTITLDGLVLVPGLPNLETLEFFSIIPNDHVSAIKALHVLSTTPKLRALSIRCLPINLDAVPALKSFKSLESLVIDASASGVTRAVSLQLSKALPRLRLTIFSLSSQTTVDGTSF
jgi:hypothetical protein